MQGKYIYTLKKLIRKQALFYSFNNCIIILFYIFFYIFIYTLYVIYYFILYILYIILYINNIYLYYYYILILKLWKMVVLRIW